MEETGETKNVLKQRAEQIENFADNISIVENHERKQENIATENEQTNNTFVIEEKLINTQGFASVAGLDDVKEAMQRRIIDPIKHPELYDKYRISRGGCILLYGPSGNGKTLIARALASEINAKFLSVRCSDIISKYYGDSEKNIKNFFEEARKEQISVIFFDEFDAIASSRNTTNSEVMQRIVNEILSQIDGFIKHKEENTLLLLASTNRPWAIDSAIMRSRRFDQKIYIPLPDEKARKYILQKSFEGIPVEEMMDIGEISTKNRWLQCCRYIRIFK
ncbi:MAG: ATP-binding protein [Defluviitaleaceae bacterium]|nr:ATP-binding protein [Defluviitaleaceae bacterium]